MALTLPLKQRLAHLASSSIIRLPHPQADAEGGERSLLAQAVWKGLGIGTNLSATPILQSRSANLRRIVP
jgi:hypothetical protein